MKIIVPPLKSQGIKTRLVPWIRSVVPSYDGTWIEPFMGTGVVGFNMRPQKAFFNDLNPHIIHFYKGIQSGDITPVSVRRFLVKEGELLRNAPNRGQDHYIHVRERFNEHFDPLDFLFLSRAGFNGMMRFNRSGRWNIPFCKKPERFSRAYITKIVNQVKACSFLIRRSWEFSCVDFDHVIDGAQKGDLVYCDPPYSGRYTDYYSGWTDADEKRLYEKLEKTKAFFILSTWHHNDYRQNRMIQEYWGRFHMVTRDHFYHTGGKQENRKPVVEALVCNF